MNTQWLDAAYRAVASLSLLPMILRVYLIAFLEMLFIAWHHLRSSIRADVKTRACVSLGINYAQST